MFRSYGRFPLPRRGGKVLAAPEELGKLRNRLRVRDARTDRERDLRGDQINTGKLLDEDMKGFVEETFALGEIADGCLPAHDVVDAALPVGCRHFLSGIPEVKITGTEPQTLIQSGIGGS